jgi:hypothetical protein
MVSVTNPYGSILVFFVDRFYLISHEIKDNNLQHRCSDICHIIFQVISDGEKRGLQSNYFH